MISVIIVNYNMKELVSSCLHSIFSDPPSTECEVVVVDNNSTDGSAGRLKENFPQVKLIENKETADSDNPDEIYLETEASKAEEAFEKAFRRAAKLRAKADDARKTAEEMGAAVNRISDEEPAP